MKLKDYDSPIKFGDEKLISLIKNQRKHDIEKVRRTIDVKTLISIGLDKFQAIDLMKKIINLKK
jgi:hypothetical protein